MSLTAKEYGAQPSQCGDATIAMVQIQTGETKQVNYRTHGLTKHERLCEIALAAIIAKTSKYTGKATAVIAINYADAMCELLAART